MVSHCAPLLAADDLGLLLEPGYDPVRGSLEVLERDGVFVAACGYKRGLVDDVGDVGAAEAGSEGCEPRCVVGERPV